MMATLFARAADEEGVRDDIAAMAVPMAYGFVGAATAIAAWWIEHPEQPTEVPALRLMNFAWSGLSRMLEGELWEPPG
jgi:hypothetical protein